MRELIQEVAWSEMHLEKNKDDGMAGSSQSGQTN